MKCKSDSCNTILNSYRVKKGNEYCSSCWLKVATDDSKNSMYANGRKRGWLHERDYSKGMKISEWVDKKDELKHMMLDLAGIPYELRTREVKYKAQGKEYIMTKWALWRMG